ncbi:MAG: hypothetical protein II625_05275 [Bacilli bacterium]|nr:hypothetical protein [Bacilli bacterium]
MNKLLKLLYVNILGLFDFNKIAVARKEGVKSNLEKRGIVTGIATLICGYIIYSFLSKLELNSSFEYLNLGFIISTLFCFIINVSLIEPIVFKNNDNDMLFSYPITKNQIVFSKLFSVYLKNIFVVLVIMISTFFAFIKFGSVNETLVLLYFVCTLFIPFVPIVLVTFLAYVNDYFKVKMNKGLFFILKYGLYIVVMGLIVLLVKGSNIINVNDGVKYVMKGLNTIYPLGYIFMETLSKESIIFFLLYVILNVLFIYLYNSVMSNNIMKICSMLQGVNKNHVFNYKKSKNLHTTWGMIRKEFHNLFNNRIYLFSSFSTNVLVFILMIIGINMINVDNIKGIEYFEVYFNNYGPALLGTLNTLTVMTISSISLEKENMQMLRTMPISMFKVLFSKWLINVLISSIFVIIEAIMVIVSFKIHGVALVLWLILPIIVLMFMSLTGLVLDYTFVSKKEPSDNVIVKQRIIVFIPTVVSLVIGLLPLFLNMGIKKGYFSAAYLVFILLLIGFEVLYLIINRKKMLENLFN